MNRFAYLTTGLAIKTLSSLSRANIHVHGTENIPRGSIIFTVNHFTRIETMILPSYIYKLTGGVPVWSLADAALFKGGLKTYLDYVGAISTRDPDRDCLILKTLLKGDAAWIIFPEGRMVKNKKIVHRGRYMILSETGKHRPHTGAASLALRTEFYRRRMGKIGATSPEEARRLMSLFEIDALAPMLERRTYIVPVNITYYPLRAHENLLSRLAVTFVEDLDERAVEELMTEGSMLLSGVDVDIRFGAPIDVGIYLDHPTVQRDIETPGYISFDNPIPSAKILRKSAAKIMERYMRSIYRMTTVNHDHLAASIIRHMPFRRIRIDDLKRRLFLATQLNLKGLEIFFHHSFETDQVHLLTDDRYGKFGDFITIAVAKGVLARQGPYLVKKKPFSTPIFNFHQIRVDNPIAVMANEVEPLERLQRKIRPIAFLPEFWIRRRTAAYLIRQAESLYEQEYETFFVDGESRPKEVGMPYLVRGKGSGIGVLLIHGYMSAPIEMAELAGYLGSKGITVYVARLRGHGTSPDDLATRTYSDWLNAVDAGFAVVRSLCKRVVVGGFSTGAALALDLVSRNEGVQGVFAVCPPRRLHDPYLKKNMALDFWNLLVKRVRGNADREKEFIENLPENPLTNYSRNPVSGIREIERLMERLDQKLPGIDIPALLIHSHRDPIAFPGESKRIFDLIGSENKTYILFNFDRHVILAGDGAHRVHRVIGDFIADLTA
ncbi:alpha/beta fold hydrolase [Desulfococcus sp.]|uniref:alpha/beta fold hydrolase n=1 Tax=Desulfococcus sp. TaxID=2025834 RepID=UPI003D0AFD73